MFSPINLNLFLDSHEGTIERKIILENPFTVILGANGSGKTHLLKGFKSAFHPDQIAQKKIRFISAGRMGMFEQYRSDYRGYGYVESNPRHGSKDYSTRRHQIETIEGDLHTLSARPDILIKVKERLRKLFNRDINIDWDGGNLHIYFSRLQKGSEQYSSAREASGLLHLTALLSALYDDEVGVLLIDEPEVSLHPQLQAFLLKEILSIVGKPEVGNNKKIIIIATHSTEMIRINHIGDLSSLIFCYDLKQDPVQISKDNNVLKNKGLQSLIKRLGQEHKLSLFSYKPLLVEGPSDVIICNALSDKLGLNLEASGSQILPVNGKNEFPATVKLLRLMGKKPIVLADADMFVDGLDLINNFYLDKEIEENANNISSKNGYSSIKEFTKSVRDNFIKYADKKIMNSENNTEYSDQNSGRRDIFCSLFNDESKDAESNRIKNTIESLFSIFEKTGLFILRKGTIESYYINKQTVEGDKIEFSISETEKIYKSQDDSLRHQYENIVSCLNYSSNGVEIREEEILREIALSIITPIYADFADGKLDIDFNVKAQGINKQNSSIFTFKLSEDKEHLAVHINSPVLNIKDFPVTLSKYENVVEKINKTLGL